MKEIDRLIINECNYIFYSGINFELIKDVEDNIFIIYIDSWENVLSSVKRNNKINTLLKINETCIDDLLDNNDQICIYQTNGFLDVIHDTVKSKLLRNPSYLPVINSKTFGIKNINYKNAV